MNSAEFQNSKIELAKLVLNIESEALLEKVRIFLTEEDFDFWNELSIEKQDEIRRGKKDVEEGRTISLNEFIRKIS